jgi:hypothetical protein
MTGDYEMAKTTVTGDAAKPKSIDTLAAITELALNYRFAERTPTLSDVARLVNVASRLLRFDSVDAKIEIENATTILLARKRQLVS